MERASTSSSEMNQSTPACTASEATLSPTAISEGHMPRGRTPITRSNEVRPISICPSASSRCEKCRSGRRIWGEAVRAESTWQMSGRIGW